MPILNGIETAYRWLKGSKPLPVQTPETPNDKKNQQENKELLTKISENTASNNDAAKGNESTISGGGQKIINVSVAKFLDNINLTTMNMREGAEDIEKMFLEMFSRILIQGAH
jgi:hypothetical protein